MLVGTAAAGPIGLAFTKPKCCGERRPHGLHSPEGQMTPLNSSGQSRSWMVLSQCHRLLSQESCKMPAAPHSSQDWVSL